MAVNPRTPVLVGIGQLPNGSTIRLTLGLSSVELTDKANRAGLA